MIEHNDVKPGALYQQYLQVAREKPNAIALQIERAPYQGNSFTWSELIIVADSISLKLVAAGVTKGVRCGIVFSDHPRILCTMLAIWKLGAVAVLIDSVWGQSRKENVLNHAEASLLVDYRSDDWLQVREGAVNGNYKRLLPEDTAMLGYTSGSTGDPKGVPFTHSKLALTMQAASAAIVAIRGQEALRIGCSMRLSGSGVFNLNYTWAAFSGATLVVLPELSIESAKKYWSDLERLAIDQVFLVPTFIELLNHLATRPSETKFHPTFLTGSSPLSRSTQDRFQEKFKLPLLNAFGLSETMCVSFYGDYTATVAANNSIGKPWLLSARIVDTQTNDVIYGQGEGELQLAGPTLFDGYFGNEVATRDAFDGRWFKTGDIARRDLNGNYQIAGRKKDVVMKGGYSIYLNEVEESALAIQGVLEAAAVPISRGFDEDLGLIVRLSDTFFGDIKDVLSLVKKDLGPQRAPYRIVAIDSGLPRTGQDKLDRKNILSLWDTLTKTEKDLI